MEDRVRPDRTPGTESVWDYPRPPALRRVRRRVVVRLGGAVIADAHEVVEILETSHPPTVYLARSDFVVGALQPAEGSSWCEYKGQAKYLDIVGNDRRAERAGWYYPDPTPAYAELTGRVALYPGAMDECRMDGEIVQPQPGSFYGGWVTSRVSGPFKGEPGTAGW